MQYQFAVLLISLRASSAKVSAVATNGGMSMTAQLTLEQLNARRKANPALLLVEALPKKYFREGHLPGARHLPHDQVTELAATLLPEHAAEIVVYCASSTCQNSHVAARRLQQLGYTRVAVFPGGKKEWLEGGLALEQAIGAVAA
jgi:rhodanese-related sulfurtransferase